MPDLNEEGFYAEIDRRRREGWTEDDETYLAYLRSRAQEAERQCEREKRELPQWMPTKDAYAESVGHRSYARPQLLRTITFPVTPEPEQEQPTMNYSTSVFLINDTLRAVQGSYEADEPAKGYVAPRETFKTWDKTLEVGDLVVVPTTTRHNFTVIKITAVDTDVDFDSKVEVRWIVGRVDIGQHQKNVAQEAEAIDRIKSAEKRKKRDDLRKNLYADHIESLKELPIADIGKELPAPDPQPSAETFSAHTGD